MAKPGPFDAKCNYSQNKIIEAQISFGFRQFFAETPGTWNLIFSIQEFFPNEK